MSDWEMCAAAVVSAISSPASQLSPSHPAETDVVTSSPPIAANAPPLVLFGPPELDPSGPTVSTM